MILECNFPLQKTMTLLNNYISNNQNDLDYD